LPPGPRCPSGGMQPPATRAPVARMVKTSARRTFQAVEVISRRGGIDSFPPGHSSERRQTGVYDRAGLLRSPRPPTHYFSLTVTLMSREVSLPLLGVAFTTTLCSPTGASLVAAMVTLVLSAVLLISPLLGSTDSPLSGSKPSFTSSLKALLREMEIVTALLSPCLSENDPSPIPVEI